MKTMHFPVQHAKLRKKHSPIVNFNICKGLALPRLARGECRRDKEKKSSYGGSAGCWYAGAHAVLHIFSPHRFAVQKFFPSFAPENGLTDGVTVALQFLELSVQVRILVGQPRKSPSLAGAFLVWGFCLTSNSYSSLKILPDPRKSLPYAPYTISVTFPVN